MNSFEKLILESYEEAKYLDTFDQLIEFVSESHDIYIDEDCTIEELLEALNEIDLSQNPLYLSLTERQNPARKRVARKRAPSQRKSSGPAKDKGHKKAKVEPKKEKPEATKPEATKQESPEAKKTESPEPSKEKGGSESEKIEQLKTQSSKLSDQISDVKKQAEDNVGKDDPKKATELELKKTELQAQKDEIISKSKSLQGDDEGAKKYKKIADLRKDNTKQLGVIVKLKESVNEAEDDESTKELITAKLQIAKNNFEIAKTSAPDGKLDATVQKGHEDEIARLEAKLNEEPKIDQAAIDAAQVKVDAATTKVTAATEAKTKLAPDASDEDKAAAETAITNAKTELDTANVELEKAKGGTPKVDPPKVDPPKVDPEAVKAAEAEVEKAKTALKTATDAKSTLKAEATPEEKAAAEKGVTDAQTALDTANTNLTKAKGEDVKTPNEKTPPSDEESKKWKEDKEKLSKATKEAKAKADETQKAVDAAKEAKTKLAPDASDEDKAAADEAITTAEATHKPNQDALNAATAAEADHDKKKPKDSSTSPAEKKVGAETKEGEGDADMKAKNKDEIEKLNAQIASLEKAYEDKKQSTTELINAAKETTDKLASNDLLKNLVSKTRLENKIKYQNSILAIVGDDQARKELSKTIKKEEATLAKIDTQLEDAQEKADEKGKDNPKYQEAKKAAKKEELANNSKDTEKRGNKDIDTSDIEDRNKDARIEYKLKIAQEKQKAISIAWQKKQDEIAETEDEDKKESLQKAADAIEKNLDAIKVSIGKFENGIDEATDTEIWTIMAMINLVEQQIENFNNEFIPLNG